MRIIFIFILFCASIVLNAQVTGYTPTATDTAQARVDPNVNQDVNMSINQNEAYFEGGNDSLFKVIYSKLEYSEEAIAANVQGNILLSFFVNFDGKVRNVNVLEGVGHGIDEKVVDIIKELVFVPAKMNNTAYRSQVFYTVPVNAMSKVR
ncbi:MAG: energy transducer TonB [Bacteroidales bacterium]|nr:energy transducer TonB [Bacteroidales bacterium]